MNLIINSDLDNFIQVKSYIDIVTIDIIKVSDKISSQAYARDNIIILEQDKIINLKQDKIIIPKQDNNPTIVISQ